MRTNHPDRNWPFLHGRATTLPFMSFNPIGIQLLPVHLYHSLIFVWRRQTGCRVIALQEPLMYASFDKTTLSTGFLATK